MADTETDFSADKSVLRSMLSSAGRWALVLGVVGFVCGFVGPMVFSPDANQGPMLGIFITGPAGALLGAMLGLLVGAARPRAAIARKALVVVSVALAAVCLYFSMPDPHYYGNVVDAEIVGCGTPETIRDKAMDDWDERVAKVTWAPPRAGWKQDFERMVAADPGAVLDVRVLRESKLYENRKPWNRGTFTAHPWGAGDAPTRYFARFAGGSCESYLTTQRAVYLAKGEDAKLWPSEILSVFLDLQVLEPLPTRFRRVVPQ
jgi:Domain of unknown function (DUF4383)